MTPYDEAIETAKRAVVLRALDDHQWCVTRAAAWLGVGPNIVHVMLRRWGLTRPARAARAARP